MESLQTGVEEAAERTGFSGAVRVERAGRTEVSLVRGLAERAHGAPITADVRFATASITKGLTALVVMSLAEDGVLDLDAGVRSVLGADLPLIADEVTPRHLLTHRSGIGDYLDETAGAAMTDYVMPVPVHRLARTEDYLAVLDGHPMDFPAGAGFSYNNAGYVVLALVAERASGTDFRELVRTRVCEPAGMVDTGFVRSDELGPRETRGYLAADGLRTNVLHLPVSGSGDGGIYSTLADLHSFWDALMRGLIVPADRVAAMLRPRSDWPEERRRYGMGFHLAAVGDAVFLEGYDAGVSAATLHQPSTATTYTVLSNWTDGAWPVVAVLGRRLGLS